MNDQVDLLQIKIEKAKEELSEDTLKAIAAVPWQAAILKLREEKGYSFEQLGDLELETELLLYGLTRPEDYPRELENSMGISGAQANELVAEMNKTVFSRIKEELIKNIERKKALAGGGNTPLPAQEVPPKLDMVKDMPGLGKNANIAGIEFLNGKGVEKKPIIAKLELPNKDIVHQVLAQKLSAPMQIPSVKTEHAPENITKTGIPTKPLAEAQKTPATYPKNADPYRLPPE